LLRHYFFAGPTGEPVLRLVVTAEELAKAADAPPAKAADVREAFFAAIACTPEQFRARLRPGRLVNGRWLGEVPPPFLPYLVFTCYAAATLDEAVAGEGDFRRRVCELLAHPAGTSYDLEHLPTLWRALREWLDGLRESGAPARRLELPDPGYMSRIGYSIRLAFPQRRDRERLAGLFADRADTASASPTVPEAFALVEPNILQFSDGFKAAFWRAKDTLAQGGDGPDLRVVWSALREAAALPSAPRLGTKNPRFHILAYDGDNAHIEPVVVTNRPIDTGETGILCIPLPNPVEEYGHYLADRQGSPHAISTLLLQQALAGDRLSLPAGSPVVRAVAEGVLLFGQVDGIAWSLCTTRAREGACRALVRRDGKRDLTTLMRKLLPSTEILVRTDVFLGWDELSGFDFADIADPVVAAPELRSIRALQRVEAGAHIHIVGGLRTASGFLGTAALLPEVRCAGANEISVYTSTLGAIRTPPRLVDRLVSIAGRPGTFGWPGPRKPVDGLVTLVASNDSGEIASRKVVFDSAVLNADYRVASDPARWLVEGGEKDVQGADASDTFLQPISTARVRVTPAPSATGSTRVVATHAVGIDDDRRFDEFAEALACIGLRRSGVPEADFIALGESLGVLDSNAARWDTIRAWMEAGYIDALTNARWRGRTYAPRLPRLVAVPTGTAWLRVVLHGLPPRVTRHRVRQAFAAAGAVEAPMASLSSCVPVPLAWRVNQASGRLEEIAHEAGLSLAWVMPPESLVGNLNSVFTDGASAPAAHTLVRSWDWAESRFRSSPLSAIAKASSPRREDAMNALPHIVVDYHARPDGPDEYHVATDDGETVAVTRSRTWALLRAFAEAGRPSFVPFGELYLVRAAADGAFVPLPAARALALCSGKLGGPAELATEGRRYVYAAKDGVQRRRILAKLSRFPFDPCDARVLVWLNAAARGGSGGRVRVPVDLRHRLEALGDVPFATALARLNVPLHLLPHLRRALSQVSKTASRIR